MSTEKEVLIVGFPIMLWLALFLAGVILIITGDNQKKKKAGRVSLICALYCVLVAHLIMARNNNHIGIWWLILAVFGFLPVAITFTVRMSKTSKTSDTNRWGAYKDITISAWIAFVMTFIAACWGFKYGKSNEF